MPIVSIAIGFIIFIASVFVGSAALDKKLETTSLPKTPLPTVIISPSPTPKPKPQVKGGQTYYLQPPKPAPRLNIQYPKFEFKPPAPMPPLRFKPPSPPNLSPPELNPQWPPDYQVGEITYPELPRPRIDYDPRWYEGCGLYNVNCPQQRPF